MRKLQPHALLARGHALHAWLCKENWLAKSLTKCIRKHITNLESVYHYKWNIYGMIRSTWGCNKHIAYLTKVWSKNDRHHSKDAMM